MNINAFRGGYETVIARMIEARTAGTATRAQVLALPTRPFQMPLHGYGLVAAQLLADVRAPNQPSYALAA